jgi:Fe-S cluster biosynthesis and repair protein YggX
MTTVTCRRCSQSREGLEKAPFPGALGEKILAGICSPCWAEWRDNQTMIINEYRLSLGDPKSQERLDREMKAFLNLEV